MGSEKRRDLPNEPIPLYRKVGRRSWFRVLRDALWPARPALLHPTGPRRPRPAEVVERAVIDPITETRTAPERATR